MDCEAFGSNEDCILAHYDAILGIVGLRQKLPNPWLAPVWFLQFDLLVMTNWQRFIDTE